MNKVVPNNNNNKINYKSKCLWQNKRDNSNSHNTYTITHSELLIMDKTIWYKAIFESFSLCSK